MPKPIASVSLDLDNLWSYLKIHGSPGWESRPSYLGTFLPHVLEVLRRLELRITFFIVGIDAENPANAAALRAIVDAGHEVGNHSFEHEPWLHRYTREQLEAEIDRADRAIVAATGQRPVGFRGPGYSWCPLLLELLAERGYGFDSSTLPSYLGPLARTYYFWTSKLSAEERQQRAGLFGHFADGLRPVKPYYWRLPQGRRLLEIPVTTTPGVKTPFHFSYLAYLAKYSEAAMRAYLWTALAACRMTGTGPSFLLHPLDLIGGEKVPELAFFPGMEVPSDTKLRLFEYVLGRLRDRFELVPMSVHARELAARDSLPLRAAQ